MGVTKKKKLELFLNLGRGPRGPEDRHGLQHGGEVAGPEVKGSKQARGKNRDPHHLRKPKKVGQTGSGGRKITPTTTPHKKTNKKKNKKPPC